MSTLKGKFYAGTGHDTDVDSDGDRDQTTYFTRRQGGEMLTPSRHDDEWDMENDREVVRRVTYKRLKILMRDYVTSGLTLAAQDTLNRALDEREQGPVAAQTAEESDMVHLFVKWLGDRRSLNYAEATTLNELLALGVGEMVTGYHQGDSLVVFDEVDPGTNGSGPTAPRPSDRTAPGRRSTPRK
jgi:hypothetical protein